MVRGAAIVLVLTYFMQANMGSIFGQFSSQERQDKVQMLKHMRGILSPVSTTVKAGVNKRAEAWLPSSAKPVLKKSWQNKPIPPSSVGSDKSKLLAQLRGIATEPTAAITDQNEEMKPREIQNVFVSVEESESDESDRPSQVIWEKPARTHLTYMEPIKKETDSGTCSWHGQQGNLEQDMDGRVSLKKAELQEIGLDNWEDYVEDAWKCVVKKFWISYDKIKKKVCGMFGAR